MGKHRILVTPRSFGKEDPAVFSLLEAAGCTVVRNDTGQILNRAELSERLRNCDGLIVGVEPVDAQILAQAPGLRAIAKYGAGVDNIDLEAASARGIKVSRTPGANADAVADYTFALILALARRVPEIDRRCRQGDWSKLMTRDVTGAVLGILGFGAIGQRVARRASGFGMKLLVHDVVWNPAWETALGVKRAAPEEIFAQADFISLHMPLLPETKGFVDKSLLDRMKSTAYLINTARGELVDETALLDALQRRAIAGAGLDAFAQEPPENPAWFHLDNVILGAHCAAATAGAARNMGRMAVENLLRDLGDGQ